MATLDFMFPDLPHRPFLIKGMGVACVAPSDFPTAVCHITFLNAPFGPLSECVAFPLAPSEATTPSQLYGISSCPRLPRTTCALIDNSHYLVEGETSLTITEREGQKTRIVAAANARSDALTCETSGLLSRARLPLIPLSEPYQLLSFYTEQRFHSSLTLTGATRRILPVEYSARRNAHLDAHMDAYDDSAAILKRVAEVFPHSLTEAPARAYFIESFSFMLPEPKGMRIQALWAKKKVAGGFACDS